MRFFLIGLLAVAVLQLRDEPHTNKRTRTARDSVRVAVRTFQFQPDPIEVEVGTTVVWHNEDDIEHTATSESAEADDSAFDLKLARQDESAAFTFEKPGAYAYYCARHSFMRGQVRVTLKGDTP